MHPQPKTPQGDLKEIKPRHGQVNEMNMSENRPVNTQQQQQPRQDPNASTSSTQQQPFPAHPQPHLKAA